MATNAIYVGAGGVKTVRSIRVGAGGVKRVNRVYVGAGGVKLVWPGTPIYIDGTYGSAGTLVLASSYQGTIKITTGSTYIQVQGTYTSSSYSSRRYYAYFPTMINLSSYNSIMYNATVTSYPNYTSTTNDDGPTIGLFTCTAITLNSSGTATLTTGNGDNNGWINLGTSQTGTFNGNHDVSECDGNRYIGVTGILNSSSSDGNFTVRITLIALSVIPHVD